LFAGAAFGGFASLAHADEPKSEVVADSEVVPHSHVLLTSKTPDKNPLIFSGTANPLVNQLAFL
jgi:hypothetical protein